MDALSPAVAVGFPPLRRAVLVLARVQIVLKREKGAVSREGDFVDTSRTQKGAVSHGKPAVAFFYSDVQCSCSRGCK